MGKGEERDHETVPLAGEAAEVAKAREAGDDTAKRAGRERSREEEGDARAPEMLKRCVFYIFFLGPSRSLAGACSGV